MGPSRPAGHLAPGAAKLPADKGKEQADKADKAGESDNHVVPGRQRLTVAHGGSEPGADGRGQLCHKRGVLRLILPLREVHRAGPEGTEAGSSKQMASRSRSRR